MGDTRELEESAVIDRTGQLWDLVGGGQCVGIVLKSYPGLRSTGAKATYHTFKVLHSDECPFNVGKTWSICEDEMHHEKSRRIL